MTGLRWVARLDGHRRSRFLTAVCRAASLSERLPGGRFVPVATPSELIAKRVTEWSQSAPGLVSDRLWPTVAHDVALDNISQLPGWAVGLADFLSLQPRYGATADNPWTTFHHAGASRARAMLTHAGMEAHEAAVAGLAEQVAHRLGSATARAFDFELQIRGTLSGAGTVRLDLSLDGWLDRLDILPGLAHAMGVTWSQWQTATTEMLSRLGEDWESLRHHFPLPPSLRLDALRGDAGDLHHGGRAVAVLRLADCQLVYKPKDLRIAQFFVELQGLVGASGTLLPGQPRTHLHRGGYGWENWVEARECRTGQEVRRFYRRLGATLRLIELLQGRDFWLDNLIASGEHPVFIDLETQLQSRPAHSLSRLQPAAAAALGLLDESAVFTGVVAAPTALGIGHQAEEFGALAPWRKGRLPYRPGLRALDANGWADRTDPDGFVVFDPPPYAPMLRGKAVGVDRNVEDLLRGHRECGNWLAAHRAEVRRFLERRPDLHRMPVRHIRQDTWTYARIIQNGVCPAALTDGVTRDVAIWRDIVAVNGDAPKDGPIMRNELSSLRDLNVPYFLAHPGDHALLCEDGSRIEGYLAGSALERLKARVEAPTVSEEERAALVLSSLGASGRRHRIRRYPHDPAPGTLSAADALDHALAIGHAVLGSAVAVDGQLAWIGLGYWPEHDLEAVQVLGDDLLSGTGGLAVMFAELFRATQERRFREAALTLLGERPAQPSRPGGAFVGTGAQIYTRHRCGRVLDVQELITCAEELAGGVDLSKAAWDHPLDIATGPAGLMLAIAATGAGVRRLTPTWSELLDRIPREALSRRPIPRTARRMEALPLPACTQRLLEARLTPTAPHVLAAPRMTSGDLLVLIEQGDPAAETPLAQLRASLGRGARWDSSRLLEAMNIASAARASRPQDDWDEIAALLAEHLTTRWRTSGSWFPERYSADHHDLSIIWGVPAVCLALLQIASPGHMPSLRLLA